MTLDYTKMFLIVTEEAGVKGHFIFDSAQWSAFAYLISRPTGRFLLLF